MLSFWRAYTGWFPWNLVLPPIKPLKGLEQFVSMFLVEFRTVVGDIDKLTAASLLAINTNKQPQQPGEPAPYFPGLPSRYRYRILLHGILRTQESLNAK